MAKSCKIGFIGVGNMGSAMINGLVGAGKYDVDKIYLFDVLAEKTEKFVAMGMHRVNSIRELYDSCEYVILSVKPQIFGEVLEELKGCLDSKRRVVFISIGAGITTGSISAALDNAPVVRGLPNTPMIVGKGVSAICRNTLVTDGEYEFACSIFSASGDVVKIDESEMNRIISALSSSPAYVFMFIKAICDGADAQGLDGEALKKSICAMVAGSAALLAASDLTPDELVQMVCSKGGTTERAVAELNEYKFIEGIISAMKKCTARADELGNLKK